MIFIVDDIGKVVQSIRTGTTDAAGRWKGGAFVDYDESNMSINDPYYIYGHRQEIASRLTEKEQRPQSQKKRYPLIALKMDIDETVRGNVNDFNLNLVIATNSKVELNAEERYVKTFKPILYPLYFKFMESFKNSGFFMWDGQLDQLYPPHVKLDRPFWGTPSSERNEKNIFNDPIDAIEIVNLKFSRLDTHC